MQAWMSPRVEPDADGGVGGTEHTSAPHTYVTLLDDSQRVLDVVSDFVRAKHAERAESFVTDLRAHLSVDSPRTHLLPRRFWSLLGSIARAHNEGLDYLLRELPQKETGFANDECHPRFVAAMLRIGDLLDLDSGRFCPVVNATGGPMPALSAAHLGKHEGVRRLFVSPQRIDVQAEYGEDIPAWEQAELWFTWLREELTGQLARWSEITPHRKFGGLPSPGTIEAKLGRQVLPKGSRRPRLEVDRDAMLDLVRGGNIYDGPWDAAREILQNAIDATTYRLAFELRARDEAKPADPLKLKQALANWPIVVELKRVNEAGIPSGRARWSLVVEDRGIGMRLEDVWRLLCVGSSRANEQRRELKGWLPEWARPSGTFGIGFHSLLEYARDVTVTTRHVRDATALQITLERRVDAADGVLVRRVDAGADRLQPDVGTKVTAIFEVDAIPSTITSSSLVQSEELVRAYATHDCILDADLPVAYWRTWSAIDSMVGQPCAPDIRLHAEGRQATSPTDPVSEERPSPVSDLFSTDDGVRISLNGVNLGRARGRTLYRGATVEFHADYELLALDIDLYAGDARDLLTLARNKWTRRGNRRRGLAVDRALRAAVPRWLTELRGREGDIDLLRTLGLFEHLYMKSESAGGTEWQDLVLPFEPEGLTLRELVDSRVLQVELVSSLYDVAAPGRARWGKASGDSLARALTLSSSTFGGWFSALLAVHFQGRSLEQVLPDGRATYRFTLPGKDSATEKIEVSDAVVRRLIDRRGGGSHDIGSRVALPCTSRFRDLGLEAIPGYFSGSGNSLLGCRSMLSPFVRQPNSRGVTVPSPERYVAWVVENGVTKNPGAVAAALISFVRYIDDEVMKDDAEWRKMRRGSVEELGRSLASLMSAT